MGDRRIWHHGLYFVAQHLLSEPRRSGEGIGRHRVVELSVCAIALMDVFQGENHMAEGWGNCGDYDWCDGVFLVVFNVFSNSVKKIRYEEKM